MNLAPGILSVWMERLFFFLSNLKRKWNDRFVFVELIFPNSSISEKKQQNNEGLP